jgi:hypothetical protein
MISSHPPIIINAQLSTGDLVKGYRSDGPQLRKLYPAKLIQIEIGVRAITSPLARTLLTYFKQRSRVFRSGTSRRLCAKCR